MNNIHKLTLYIYSSIIMLSATITDNSRYDTKVFKVRQNSVLHGFSGYFDTVLFNNITLSIKPSTHSPGMFSWFPIFFPIRVR